MKQPGKHGAIRTYLKQHPPGIVEQILKSVSGLQRRRRRAVLILRGMLLVTLLHACKIYDWPQLRLFLVCFGMAFFGSIVLIHWIALQYESSRIRKVAKKANASKRSVTRILLSMEKQK